MCTCLYKQNPCLWWTLRYQSLERKQDVSGIDSDVFLDEIFPQRSVGISPELFGMFGTDNHVTSFLVIDFAKSSAFSAKSA